MSEMALFISQHFHLHNFANGPRKFVYHNLSYFQRAQSELKLTMFPTRPCFHLTTPLLFLSPPKD